MDYIRKVAALRPILQGADHIDVKVVEGDVSLRQFIAGLLNYAPGWLTMLYRVRGGFVRLLGMRQEGVPRAPHMDAAAVPMTVGAGASFFTVRLAEDGVYWVASAGDRHLDATLGVVAEPLSGRQQRFHVLTVVHYRNWAGPVYFTVIRPFHHLVVRAMARAAVLPPPA